LPKVSREFAPTAIEEGGFTFDEMGQGVVAGIDGGLAGEIRLLVLVDDVLVGKADGFFAQKGRDPFFYQTNKGHDEADDKGFWDDMVGRGEIGAMFGPVDRFKTLRVKFGAELEENGIKRSLPTASVEIGHREINNSDIARDIRGMDRNPFWQKI
jgi:hypothetical protein